MDADVAAGRTPFLVAANAGATNSGAIDPLPELADACREHGAWLHVDAAYGGFAVLAERGELLRRDRAGRLAHARPAQVALPADRVRLRARARTGGRCERAFEIAPDYLRDAEAGEEEVNFSDLGLQLTRSARALKVWVSLRYFGLAAFREAIDASSSSRRARPSASRRASRSS